MTPVGLDVAAERRHLEGPPVRQHGHRAMLDAGRHRLQTSRLDAGDGLGRQRRGGDVDVGDRAPHQRVADRTTHHPRLLAACRQAGQDGLEGGVAEPVRLDARHDA